MTWPADPRCTPAPPEIVTRPLEYVERQESRPCANCGKPISPGSLYTPSGPLHLGCGKRRFT